MNGHDLVWCPLMHIEQGAEEWARAAESFWWGGFSRSVLQNVECIEANQLQNERDFR